MARCSQNHSYDGEIHKFCPVCPRPGRPETIDDWVKICHQNSQAHGFYDDYYEMIAHLLPVLVSRLKDLYIAERISLIHSEGSECLEDARSGDMEEIKGPNGKPLGFPSELADIVIRCFDLAGFLEIDLEAAIARKHAYNKTRPKKHGKKF